VSKRENIQTNEFLECGVCFDRDRRRHSVWVHEAMMIVGPYFAPARSNYEWNLNPLNCHLRSMLDTAKPKVISEANRSERPLGS
jgi:hypothetical protein